MRGAGWRIVVGLVPTIHRPARSKRAVLQATVQNSDPWSSPPDGTPGTSPSMTGFQGQH